MEKTCKDFDSWLVQNISDPREAAYFLLAALEDSIEYKHMEHYFRAMHKVCRLHGLEASDVINFLFANIDTDDHKDAQKSISLVMGTLVSTVESAHLELA